MSNPVFETTDRLPLAGKIPIRLALKGYSEATESQEKQRFIATQAFLIGMTAVHAYQAYMGYEAIDTHLTDVISNEADPLTYVATSVDAMYIAVNSLVSARQANLVTRVQDMRKKKRKRWDTLKQSTPLDTDSAPSQKTPERSPAKVNSRKAIAALAITLAGQLVFMESYGHAKDQACEQSASQYYEEYTTAHPDELFTPESEYIEAACDS